MSSPTSQHAPKKRSRLVRGRSAAHRLPQDVLALIARFLTVDTGEDPHDSLEARQSDALSMARACKAWRAAGTAAYWREIEVKPKFAYKLQDHLEAHKSLYGNIESVMVNVITVGLSFNANEARSTVPAILAACPHIWRLEVIGKWWSPGALFQGLQDKLDLSKLTAVVIAWGRETNTWAGSPDTGVLSPLVLFSFVRKCKSLRDFAYEGWGDLITNPTPGPPDRRLKLHSLRLDIKNPADDEAQMSTPNMRMLPHQLQPRAPDRMRNLTSLKLPADFALKTGGLDELSSRLPLLTRLQHFDLTPIGTCEPHDEGAPTIAELRRMLYAIPPSLEDGDVRLAIPERVVDTFFDERLTSSIKSFRALVYDPLDLMPTLVLQRYSKVVPNLSRDGYWCCDEHGWMEHEDE
ncbi:hypothetical protein JCM10449v2_005493 [Rhodotorula kratochvilovae]